MQQLQAGSSFGPYRVEGLVAGGGMGQVYAVRHERYDVLCALKVLHEALHRQDDWRRRFTEEGKVGAQLKHPNVLSARELVEHEGRVAILMDLVKGGQTLEKVVAREFPQGLPVADALTVFRGILQGIEYLHDREVVHGDLKPENILIEGDYRKPDSWRPLVTDFGTVGLVAHPVVIDGRTAVVATPRYASPEHLLGIDRVEVRSDIYCLGLLLHFLLTGRHISDARTVREAALFVMDTVPDTQLVDQHQAVRDMFCAATSVDPDDRYPSCHELSLAVRAVLDALGIQLQVEDVSAELATEVDEPRARAQAALAQAAQNAQDAPPPPDPQQLADRADTGSTDPVDPAELPTEVDRTNPPSAAAPQRFEPGVDADPPARQPSPSTAPPPPRVVSEPAPAGGYPKQSDSEVTLGPVLGHADAAPARVEGGDPIEDGDTGDSVVDELDATPAPAAPSRADARPRPISAPPAPPPVNPLIPMSIGIVAVLTVGLGFLYVLFG